VTTHAAVLEAIADPRVQKDKKHWRAFNAGEIPPDWTLISWIITESMMNSDGKEHSRLRGLVSSYPRDLPLRRRLGEVYRLYGEPAQAGRWMYLEADRDAAETAAFQQRYASTGVRMAALAWSGDEAEAATAFAREQLAALRRAHMAAVGRPVGWQDADLADEEPTADDDGPLGCVLAALAAVGFLAVWVLGFVTLVRWIF
jgi:hypothetical protein